VLLMGKGRPDCIFKGDGNFFGESPLMNPLAEEAYLAKRQPNEYKKLFDSGKMSEIFNLNNVHQQDCYALFMASVHGSKEEILKQATDKQLPRNVRRAAFQIIVAARKNGFASGPDASAVAVKKPSQTSFVRVSP